mmetsp:Transcript_76735/g.222786  ORF Transcript_76735/g.222786 Transcript_76735/m.222786 type:complete len:208 (-) Transcript_76735:105-728(-)
MRLRRQHVFELEPQCVQALAQASLHLLELLPEVKARLGICLRLVGHILNPTVEERGGLLELGHSIPLLPQVRPELILLLPQIPQLVGEIVDSDVDLVYLLRLRPVSGPNARHDRRLPVFPRPGHGLHDVAERCGLLGTLRHPSVQRGRDVAKGLKHRTQWARIHTEQSLRHAWYGQGGRADDMLLKIRLCRVGARGRPPVGRSAAHS